MSAYPYPNLISDIEIWMYVSFLMIIDLYVILLKASFCVRFNFGISIGIYGRTFSFLQGNEWDASTACLRTLPDSACCAGYALAGHGSTLSLQKGSDEESLIQGKYS